MTPKCNGDESGCLFELKIATGGMGENEAADYSGRI